MDKTPYCRDKCASSADMLSCMRDCTGMTSTPNLRASSPMVFPKMDKKKAALVVGGGVAAVVVIALVLRHMKKI